MSELWIVDSNIMITLQSQKRKRWYILDDDEEKNEILQESTDVVKHFMKQTFESQELQKKDLSNEDGMERRRQFLQSLENALIEFNHVMTLTSFLKEKEPRLYLQTCYRPPVISKGPQLTPLQRVNERIKHFGSAVSLIQNSIIQCKSIIQERRLYSTKCLELRKSWRLLLQQKSTSTAASGNYHKYSPISHTDTIAVDCSYESCGETMHQNDSNGRVNLDIGTNGPLIQKDTSNMYTLEYVLSDINSQTVVASSTLYHVLFTGQYAVRGENGDSVATSTTNALDFELRRRLHSNYAKRLFLGYQQDIATKKSSSSPPLSPPLSTPPTSSFPPCSWHLGNMVKHSYIVHKIQDMEKAANEVLFSTNDNNILVLDSKTCEADTDGDVMVMERNLRVYALHRSYITVQFSDRYMLTIRMIAQPQLVHDSAIDNDEVKDGLGVSHQDMAMEIDNVTVLDTKETFPSQAHHNHNNRLRVYVKGLEYAILQSEYRSLQSLRTKYHSKSESIMSKFSKKFISEQDDSNDYALCGLQQVIFTLQDYVTYTLIHDALNSNLEADTDKSYLVTSSPLTSGITPPPSPVVLSYKRNLLLTWTPPSSASSTGAGYNGEENKQVWRIDVRGCCIEVVSEGAVGGECESPPLVSSADKLKAKSSIAKFYSVSEFLKYFNGRIQK